jgi:hypothetical protein
MIGISVRTPIIRVMCGAPARQVAAAALSRCSIDLLALPWTSTGRSPPSPVEALDGNGRARAIRSSISVSLRPKTISRPGDEGVSARLPVMLRRL